MFFPTTCIKICVSGNIHGNVVVLATCMNFLSFVQRGCPQVSPYSRDSRRVSSDNRQTVAPRRYSIRACRVAGSQMLPYVVFIEFISLLYTAQVGLRVLLVGGYGQQLLHRNAAMDRYEQPERNLPPRGYNSPFELSVTTVEDIDDTVVSDDMHNMRDTTFRCTRPQQAA